jgi:hypothetical protein
MQPNGFPVSPSNAFRKPSAGDGEFLTAQPGAEKLYALIIVARDQPDLWHALVRRFVGYTKVQVLEDRRRWERRRRVHRDDPDRRRADRRRPPSIDDDLHYRPFLIATREQETP